MQCRIRIEHIFISDGHRFYGREMGNPGPYAMREVSAVECVAGQGLRGDRFFGFRPDYKGQVTFFSAEVFDEVRRLADDPRLPASAPRRNLVIRGVDLNRLIGARFLIGGVGFAGEEECSPCEWMEQAIGPGAKDALKDRGGLRARIVSSGTLRRGGGVLGIIPEPRPASAAG